MRSLLEHKRKVVPVIVGGETYHVRSWTLGERIRFADLSRANKDKGQAALVACVLRMSVCDNQGNESFTDDDLPALTELQDGTTGQALANASYEVNGLGEGKLESAKKD